MQLTKNELLTVKGGGIGLIAGIGAILTFLIGVIDGLINLK